MSSNSSTTNGKLNYQSGFGNYLACEALAGALPEGQNSPQQAPYGLYAEQLSGSAFTAQRSENRRLWFYRIRPSVVQSKFDEIDRGLIRSRPFITGYATPNQLRWEAVPELISSADFIEGLVTFAGNGDLASCRGSAVHIYAVNRSMGNRFLYNSDGELLIVPQLGELELRTECGDLSITSGEIGVIPRGIKFQVNVSGFSRGYVCENYGPNFRLPDLGLIGSNGLANPRDFLMPCAAYKDEQGKFALLNKFNGRMWEAKLDHYPLDVVAWHGNYYPYKYDLAKFQAINSVSFDHSDPSIYTVLHSPSEIPGTPNVDLVVFPPRWQVAEHTFRPPYFHRNVASEFLGNIRGAYEAKKNDFGPGASSLHCCMSAHGPDTATFKKASSDKLEPEHLKDTLSIMFESSLVYIPTEYAIASPLLQQNYLDCWKGLKSNFNPKKQ